VVIQPGKLILIITGAKQQVAELSGKVINENEVLKNLIIELIKENQKLKTKNKLFNNN
tara:strand:+ start:1053 stop:1226 length:174 start_codon:yes stop_codon:yes gene_type:complete